jgi:hypothetical protein
VSGPINPILVVKNNLPGYREELIAESARLVARVMQIDEELGTLQRLSDALIPPAETMAVTDGR